MRYVSLLGIAIAAVVGCGTAPVAPAASTAPEKDTTGFRTPPAPTLSFVPQTGVGNGLDPFDLIGDNLLVGKAGETIQVWSLEAGKLLRVLAQNELKSVAAVPGKPWIVSFGKAKGAEIVVHDAETGAVLRTLQSAHPVTSMVVTPDGQRLVLCADREIWVVDLATGAELGAIDVYAVLSKILSHDAERSPVVSPDGEHLATFVAGDGIAVWSLSRLALVRSREPSPPSSANSSANFARHRSLGFAPSGDAVLAVVAERRIVRMPLTGGEATVFEPPREMSVDAYASAFTSDGKFAILAGTNGSSYVVDATTGALVNRGFGPGGGGRWTRFKGTGARGVFQEFDPRGAVHLVTRELPSGKLLSSVDIPSVRAKRIVFAPDGTRLAIASVEGIRLWDTASLAGPRLIAEEHLDTVAFTHDAKALIVEKDGAMTNSNFFTPTGVLDLGTGLLRARLSDRGGVAALSPDGKRVAVMGSPPRIYALETSAALVELQSPTDFVAVHVDFSPDGSLLMASDFSNKFVLFDASSGKKLAEHEQTELGSPFVFLTNDLILHGWDELEIREARGKVRKTAKVPSPVEALALSPDRRTVLAGLADGRIAFVEPDSLELRSITRGHAETVTGIVFSPDGRQFASCSADGTARLWNTASRESVVLFARGSEWVAYDDQGYFDASRRGHELVSAVKGYDVFRIEQLAVRNNRPDLLLSAVGLGSEDQRAHFRGRYQKRLRQMGIHEADLASTFDKAPLARISSVERIGSELRVAATLSSNAGGLARYQLYVNGVPFYPAPGREVSGSSADVSERIPLSGKAYVEVSAISSGGVESLRNGRLVEGPPPAARDLYFVGMGVSSYKDKSLDLAYAHKDALDLAATLELSKGTFRDVHTLTFVNEQVTVEAFARAKAMLSKATVDDTVVVFVAGHGTHSRDAAADYLYLLHGTERGRLRETTASFDLVEGLVSDLHARRKLLLLDTCESGDIDDDELVATSRAGGARGLRTRALVLEVPSGLQSAARALVRDRERFIYNDLARRTGTVVFSSSRGGEVSFERDDIQNGVFTEDVLLALAGEGSDVDQDGVISAEELRVSVSAAVAKRTDNLQHPTVDRDNPLADLRLPVVKGARQIAQRKAAVQLGKR
jgi:WD40 repeat protein